MQNDDSTADPTPRRSLRDTLDLLVALAALVTSAVSIWLAISQGDDMEKLVQAQSWPYVGFSSGNSSLDPATNERIRSLSFSVDNLGVGPARVRTMEVLVDGVAVPHSSALMLRAAGLGEDAPLARETVYTTQVSGRVLRAGESITYLRWDHLDSAEPAWSALDKARFGRVVVRVCFCSVFDECWLNRSDATDAQPVDACPAVATPYYE